MDNNNFERRPYLDFKRLMPLDAEPSRAGAENVIEQLQAIGISVGSKNLEDHLDTGIIQTLKKEGFFCANTACSSLGK